MAEGAEVAAAAAMWLEKFSPGTMVDKEEEAITATVRMPRPHPYLSERCVRSAADKEERASTVMATMRCRQQQQQQQQRRLRPYLSERCVHFPTQQPKVPVLAIASG